MIGTLREERIVREEGYTSPPRAKRPWKARERVGDEELSKHFDCKHDDCEWIPVCDEPFETNPFPIEKTSGIIGEKQPEAIEFCKRHGILSYVEEAKTFVEECFPSRKALHIRLDDDPDEEGEWIVIEVTIEQDVDDFLKAYNRCISLWAKMIPSEALTIIRLSYNFV